ncbi:unnamed protein product [Strongylus vulgaris]|uniref:Telomerase activating protein Est1-like N-terminal domain-containing protein n=1 Tax=Strongylus vulgaris TaxID=40348 RepID=A0A3P7JNF1_STRVU|nr:unnamed protein product [Strongylus vulgaris]
MNLEQHLWKQAFYKPIEVFKTVVNSPKENTRTFRGLLLALLNKGIAFYERLLELYKKELNVDLDKAMLIPSLLHENDFWDVSEHSGAVENGASKQKVAIKSCSRHLISMGDLKRYKALVEGSEDYTDAGLAFDKVLGQVFGWREVDFSTNKGLVRVDVPYIDFGYFLFCLSPLS